MVAKVLSLIATANNGVNKGGQMKLTTKAVMTSTLMMIILAILLGIAFLLYIWKLKGRFAP